MTDLRHNRFDEALTAESGVDGHRQDEIAELDGGGEGFRRGGRIDGDPSLGASVADHLQRPLEMPLGLLVDRDHVCAGVEKTIDVALRLFDHQMAIEPQLAHFTAGLDDCGPHRDVGHEMAVHHVEVEKVGALFNGGDFLREFREVGGEQRWRDLDVHVAGCRLPVAGYRLPDRTLREPATGN